MFTLETKIEQLKKVGPVYLKKLHQLNIKTIRDLFFHFPHRYDDFGQITSISQLQLGQTATIQGKISQIKNTWTWRRRMALTEAMIEDKTGSIRAIWFNQPYLIKILKQGKIANLAGKVSFAGQTLCFSNPAHEMVPTTGLPRGFALRNDNYTHTGRLVPIYPETAGLSSRYLRYLIKPLLPLLDKIPDFLPLLIKKNFNLINLAEALRQIHFPRNQASAQQARQRLAFDELFLIQLFSLRQKQKLNQEKAVAIPFEQKLIKSFVKELPFKLTDDQRIAAWEIFQDLNKGKPMNRLLNGDVGSGKTVVAMMAALETAKTGYQVALMAPTEILAKQHFQTFNNFLEKTGLKIGLLTGASDDKKNLKKQISQGEINIIIGTHALIQENLFFKNLALAIIDEQHRFGVAQRAALQQKIYQIEDGLPTLPHLLSMTATPIPRTLTLTVYGDLDISLIKQMPKGRQKIITKIVAPADREKIYDFIKKQIQQKKQVFVICPRIEASQSSLRTAESSEAIPFNNNHTRLPRRSPVSGGLAPRNDSQGWDEVKSVTQEYEKLSKKVFPQFKIAMLHGKLKSKEKEEIMKKFRAGQTDILVSTSVVEVGVDIPNAAVMMIEGADRFGLAQLHQFRGRIGRGPHQSYCFLFTDSSAKKTHQRLKAVLIAKDGFELAEKDLKIRGPGEFIGTRQWGLPDLTMASLDDLDLIKKARQAAALVLNNNLFNPTLEQKLKNFQQVVHLE